MSVELAHATPPEPYQIELEGVFFRKHTQSQAKKLGLTGWVQNTKTGTVIGCLEGPEEKVNTMRIWLEKTGSPDSQIDKKKWLQETGSPKSRIEKCVFKEEKKIDSKQYKDFTVNK